MKKVSNYSEITIIIPTLNEERNLQPILSELQNLGFSKILVIDGNSHDRTVEIAKDMGVNVLLQNGKGKGNALRQAFRSDEINSLIVIMDADGSMDPHELCALIEPVKNEFDIAKGSRFIQDAYSEDMTLTRRFGNSFFVFLVNSFFGCKFTDLCYGYAAFKKEAILKLIPTLRSNGFEIETEIFINARKIGLNITEVPSIEYKRVNGVSNLNTLKDGFRILKLIFRSAFSRGARRPMLKAYLRNIK